jgi:hypothetical protein
MNLRMDIDVGTLLPISTTAELFRSRMPQRIIAANHRYLGVLEAQRTQHNEG